LATARNGHWTTTGPLSNTPAFKKVVNVSADLSVHIARVGLDYRF
jgi:hypothetical protein